MTKTKADDPRKAPKGRARKPSPVLSWQDKRWSCGDESGDSPAATFQPIEAPAVGPSAGRILHGDALQVARGLAKEPDVKGHVDVIYMDPPFASQEDYLHEARLDGTATGRTTVSFAFGDRWATRKGGDDGISDYLEHLAPRLEASARLLSRRGSLWVHVDYRASYLVRVLLDEIMGRDAFINEIVWRRAPNLGRQATSHQFGRTIDTIVVYGGPDAELVPPTRPEPIETSAVKFDSEGRPFTTAPRGDYTDESIRRLDAEGRVHRSSSGQVYIKYFCDRTKDGEFTRERRVDSLWTDIPPLRHTPASERTGYPTQKPEALLERIVACASPAGGLVVDLFSGSGTTAQAAFKLGRRFILGDQSPLAVATSRARLLRSGAEVSLERCESAPAMTLEVSCTIQDEAGETSDQISITLEAPAEPLAWSVGYTDRSGLFRRVWHSERGLGKKPVPVVASANVARREGGYEVRVYGDDGALGLCTLAAVAASSPYQATSPTTGREA